jgi:hypothetical protein
MNPVLRRELPRDDVFAAAASVELTGVVVPGATQFFAGGERPHTGDAWPITGTVDETFLGTVLKDVAQARDGRGVVGHDNGAVATGPESLTPIVQASYLAGDVAVDEGHEGGKLVSVVDGDKPMPMIGEDNEGVDANTNSAPARDR